MPYKLLARRRMLALTQPRELFLAHFAMQSVTLGELALPLTAHMVALRVIVVPRVGELFLVVLSRLARADRFGHRNHGCLLESGTWFLRRSGTRLGRFCRYNRRRNWRRNRRFYRVRSGLCLSRDVYKRQRAGQLLHRGRPCAR